MASEALMSYTGTVADFKERLRLMFDIDADGDAVLNEDNMTLWYKF